MIKLRKLKLLLNQTGNEQDDYLDYLLELVQEQIMLSLGLSGKSVPDGLENIIISMTAEYVKQNHLVGQEGTVKSVQRGDTAISYHTADLSAASIAEFISLYDSLLLPFKKVRMR